MSNRQLNDDQCILLAAANRIERHGLCKRVLRDGERHCMMGAILREAGEELESICGNAVRTCELADLVAWVNDLPRANLRMDGVEGWSTCAQWNNASERTAEDVVGALRRTAETLLVS
jgi:hypothetical protein